MLGGNYMNFLDKLNLLMEKQHLNKNTLSKACNIPYTTIDGWYKRGYEELKLPTLKKLSNYFKVSLDYWANDDLLEPIPLQINNFILAKKDEIELICNYRILNNLTKAYIRGITNGLIVDEKFLNNIENIPYPLKSTNLHDNFTQDFKKLNPKEQQIILEFIKFFEYKVEDNSSSIN